MSAKSLDQIVNLAKRRGFVFPSSEIYGGLASTWDYGPYGVLLKNNIKAAWWKAMVQERDDVVGLDAAILMHPRTWEASGHVDSFTDPLVECKQCHNRFREDKLAKAKDGKLVCPNCGTKDNFTDPKNFNILMKTYLGTIEGEKSEIYLRGETCQGIYVNFKNVLNTSRQKIPFGIAQIGKAFRNEITPGNFIFRTREFEQMEMQYFCNPKSADKLFAEWKETRLNWYKAIGINLQNIHFLPHDKLAHYAKAAEDIEYKTPWGWDEFEGIHNRGDWDLSRHSQFSGKDLSYFDESTGEKFTPYIIETSVGADRATLMALFDAYDEEEIREQEAGSREQDGEKSDEGGSRTVLRFNKSIAPIKVAVMPLLKNKPELVDVAKGIFHDLKTTGLMTEYDESGSIGKRYRRQDEIGTPACVTIDFQTLEDKTVTLRDRDTMEQSRIKIDKIADQI
jgi:glycyl-tRNA synthetase